MGNIVINLPAIPTSGWFYNNFKDLKHYYMQEKTGISGATPELERQFYMQELGVTGGNLFDLEKRWLSSQGLTNAAITDMWIELLRRFLYTPDVSGQLKYYQDNL